MLENKFQANLIKELKERFPGCIVMKSDSSYIQGIPDLLVLHNDKWASFHNALKYLPLWGSSIIPPNLLFYLLPCQK